MSTGIRNIPSGLATTLSQEVMQLALLLDITRKDGVVIGFTTVDFDIIYGGITYSATTSLDITSIRQSVGTGIDNVDLTGAIDSSIITESDLYAGLYDNAQVRLMMCDYTDLSKGVAILLVGFIGQLTYEDGKFLAEFRSLMQRTTAKCGNITSQSCRVTKLGNSQCAPGGNFQNGLTISSYRFTRTLSAVSADGYSLTFSSDSSASGYYDYGRVWFTTGPASGQFFSREIKSHTLVSGQAVIVLQEAFPFSLVVGNSAVLEAGCDRLYTTCRNKFGNYYNFRGEPYIPGNDVLKRIAR